MEYLAHIEIGQGIVTLNAKPRYIWRSIRTNVILGGITNVSPYLAPCVVREKVEPMAEMLFETCLERIVVAGSFRRYVSGAARKLRIGNIQLWIFIRRQQFRYVIGTDRCYQVAPLRAHIGKRG